MYNLPLLLFVHTLVKWGAAAEVCQDGGGIYHPESFSGTVTLATSKLLVRSPPPLLGLTSVQDMSTLVQRDGRTPGAHMWASAQRAVAGGSTLTISYAQWPHGRGDRPFVRGGKQPVCLFLSITQN